MSSLGRAPGDLGSIANHLDALAPMGDDTLDLYRLLCRATVPLAQQRGAIDESLAARFHALLDEPAA